MMMRRKSISVYYVVLISRQGWVVASDSITEERYVVRGLRPDTTYLFLVRSRNSHGISLPSHVSASIRTKGCHFCQ